MDRRRVTILPGIRHRCRSCGLLVRRHRGFDEELLTLDPHRCAARSTWDVVPEPKPRRLGWVWERLGRWLSW